MKYLNIFFKCKKELLICLFAIILNTFSIVIIPISINFYIRKIDTNNFEINHLLITFLILFSLYLVQALFSILWYLSLDLFGPKFIMKLKEEMMNKIIYSDYLEIERIGINKIKSILFSDTFDAFRIYGFFYPKIFSSLFIIISMIIYSLFINTKATLFLLCGCLIGFIITLLIRRRLSSVGRITNKAIKNIQASDIDFCDNIVEIKTNMIDNYFYNINDYNMNKFRIAAQKEDSKTQFYQGIIDGYNCTLSIIVSLFIAYFTKSFVIENILFYSIVTDLIISGFSIMESNLRQIFKLKVCFENIDMVLQLKNNNGKYKIDNVFKIKFENVNFKYLDKNILNNLNLDFKPNLYMLKGKNGSGKSTLIKAIMGIYNINDGAIRINDINLTDIDKNSYLNKILYVGQDEKLQNLKIIDYHKLLLKELFDEEKYISLCNTFNIDFNSIIENNGLNLSVGQRKKILLIKLFMAFSNKDLIILDEIFAGLDLSSKRLVREFIKENLKNKIVILVDHELNLNNLDYKLINIEEFK